LNIFVKNMTNIASASPLFYQRAVALDRTAGLLMEALLELLRRQPRVAGAVETKLSESSVKHSAPSRATGSIR
jgi:hypothetical protein